MLKQQEGTDVTEFITIAKALSPDDGPIFSGDIEMQVGFYKDKATL